MKIDTHYELLTKLYLRLKGFIVSNLIIHSDRRGESKGEIDIIAVRMPFHAQEYRWVNVTDYLNSPDSRIEILIADVKNVRNLDHVKFNDGLRKDNSSIKQLIDWIGIYESVETKEVERFSHYLNLHRKENNWQDFAFFDEDHKLGKFRLKFTFFCPNLPPWNGKGFKYVNGEEMMFFIWECLNETKQIKECSRRYNFGNWNELEPYVRFFKEKKEMPSIKDFEAFCASQ